MRAALAISSSVGSRPRRTTRSRSTRIILRSRSTMWMGILMVRARFAMPRSIDSRIHQVA
jgi:hypothetical protein